MKYYYSIERGHADEIFIRCGNCNKLFCKEDIPIFYDEMQAGSGQFSICPKCNVIWACNADDYVKERAKFSEIRDSNALLRDITEIDPQRITIVSAPPTIMNTVCALQVQSVQPKDDKIVFGDWETLLAGPAIYSQLRAMRDLSNSIRNAAGDGIIPGIFKFRVVFAQLPFPVVADSLTPIPDIEEQIISYIDSIDWESDFPAKYSIFESLKAICKKVWEKFAKH